MVLRLKAGMKDVYCKAQTHFSLGICLDDRNGFMVCYKSVVEQRDGTLCTCSLNAAVQICARLNDRFTSFCLPFKLCPLQPGHFHWWFVASDNQQKQMAHFEGFLAVNLAWFTHHYGEHRLSVTRAEKHSFHRVALNDCMSTSALHFSQRAPAHRSS